MLYFSCSIPGIRGDKAFIFVTLVSLIRIDFLILFFLDLFFFFFFLCFDLDFLFESEELEDDVLDVDDNDDEVDDELLDDEDDDESEKEVDEELQK
jgi:hypothetical protein